MMRERITILAIDDDSGDAELLNRHLTAIQDFDVDFIHAGSPAEAKTVLAERAVDAIFLDHLLGPETGLDLLEQLRAAGELRPVIALTGIGNEYVARDLMRKGADDYLAKRDISPELLRRSIETATGRFHRRRLEALTQTLTQELKTKNEILEQKNNRLAELYETAHEFVDNVSHEFRTPLTVIKEFTSLLNDGLVGEVSPEQKEYFGTILDRVDDLATMIDDMLDISKLEAGLLGVARRVCNFAEVMHRVKQTLQRKAASYQVKLTTKLECDLPEIFCDPQKIGRVILNLSINAIKFSNEGSEVVLWAKDESTLGVIRIGVTDHGPGIDPDKLEECFERFNQCGGEIRSSTKGFGLGLNIARELVLLNLGDIDVTSEVGQGTTFTFTVPTANPDTLIRRYLDRLDAFRSGSSYVSLITVELGHSISEAERGDATRFIQHQIRKSDLLFPACWGGWIVVAASNQPELGGMVQRMNNARVEANRNRPGAQLPHLVIQVQGTWPVHDGREELVAAFRNALAPMEALHA